MFDNYSILEKDRSKAVQSGLWMIWDIYKPVLVSVLPKIGKRPDWTGLSSTNISMSGPFALKPAAHYFGRECLCSASWEVLLQLEIEFGQMLIIRVGLRAQFNSIKEANFTRGPDV